MSEAQIPVTIVGAGPVGLTLANLLGAYNIPTLVIERNLHTVKEPRAVSIDDESLRTLQVAGLAASLQSLCAMDYGSVYLDPKRRSFASVSPSTAEYGYPRRSAFAQPELEAMLHQGLARYPHVEVRLGEEVVGLQQDAHGVRLEIQRQDSSHYDHYSRYAAACDGGRSPLRHMLGVGMSGHTYEKKWLIIDLKGTLDNFRQTRVYCDPRRPGINLPGPNGTRRFEFMLLEGETDEQVTAPTFISQLLRTHGPDEHIEIVRKQVYTFHALMADQWRKDAVFLLGDAAHLTPPFAGQGLNSGLRDAANLSWKLANVIQGRANPALLDSYGQERPEHAWQLIEMAMKLGRIMMPDTLRKAWWIQAGFRALRLAPPVNDYITQMRYKPKPRFSKGYFLPDQASARHTLVGRMLAQPWVETLAREQCRLDDVIGTGWALIAFHEDPTTAFENLPFLPFEERLGLTRLCITPQFYNPFSATAPTPLAVRDMHGNFERQYPSARQSWLLLRPDRYVMAVIPKASPNHSLAKLNELLR